MAEGKRLTKRAVDAFVACNGKPAFLWDGDLRGFGVKVNPGGSKVFILQYRNDERRLRRVEVGRYGVMTLDQARDHARILMGQVAQGSDPASERQAVKSGLTVGQLCDWFMAEAEAGRLLGRKRRPIKASTLAMDRSRIECHIRPLLGRRKVAALRVTDVEQMQIDIAEGKTAKPRGEGRGGATSGGQGAASRSVTTLHNIFGHALRHGLIAANPALGVRKFPDQQKKRRLSREEISALGKALREMADIEHPVGLAVVRLLALSGLRLGEARGVQHAWVSDAGYIAYPDTKTGAQIRVIGAPALKLLRAQPQQGDNPYVFPSDGGQTHFIAADGVLGRVCQHLGFTDVTAHTLRHTFGSIAGELGYSELTIAAMLGHAAGSVTGRYVHIDDAVRSAAERVSGEIAKLLDGESGHGTTLSSFSFSTPTLSTCLTAQTGSLLTVRIAASALS